MNERQSAQPSRAYELLTARLAPFAADGETIHFDRLGAAPVDDQTVGLVAECLVDRDPDARQAGLFVLAGLQDDRPERLEPFRPLQFKVRELLLDPVAAVRCDALMAFAYFDPEDLHEAVHEFLGDPHGRNRLQAVRILEAEQDPKNLAALLRLGVDPYHEAVPEDEKEWLLVREAARTAIETVASVQFPERLAEEEIEGVPCLYHAWDPVWRWAAQEGIR